MNVIHADKIIRRLESGATPTDVATELGLDVVGGAVVLPGWHVDDDGSSEMEYPDAISGAAAAQEYVDTGWGPVESTEWVDVRAWRIGYEVDKDGDVVEIRVDEELHTIEIDPEEPDCTGDSYGHDWQSPYELLGGCCWSSGGGVKYTSVCSHCGAYCDVDTWASHGAIQGMTSTTYREPDELSLEWISRERQES